ncbi:hypothetical protein WMY93_026267 [Mugilogobius chulae]|uniref:C-type lectin domain-containing protein n=1 Tax=Mugilogobius chulae TaxID=88201 RepID=A0AAW0N786_9GOBI
MLLNSKFICLLFISGFTIFSQGFSEFHLINVTKSYADAKSYCREMYTDLATINNFSEMNALINLVSGKADRAWIGLEIAENRTWHWSLPAYPLDFTNWRDGTPQENDQDSCAAMDENGKWFESNCTDRRSFVCHSDEGSHIFVSHTKTWRDAQKYCRDLLTDLVSIQSPKENAIVSNMSQNVWIGLFKDPWKWSDGRNSSFRYWVNSQPNYLDGQDCVTVVFKNKGKWNDLKCTGRRKFICQGAYKGTTTIKTTTQGTAIVTYVGTHFNITSEAVTLTIHFTVDKNSTNVSTTASSTTEGPSASPNMSQPVTLAPHSKTPGNFVLIQQNLTWVEAIIYCRRNYIDLIHIPTEEIQVKVAET